MSIDASNMPAGDAVLNAPPPPSTNRRWSPRGARDALQPVSAPEPPQPPRKPRGGGLLARLSGFLTLLVFLAAAGGAGVIYGRSVFNSPGPLQQDKVVFIPRGSGASEIAGILEQNGVISSALAFEAAHVLSGGAALKAGEYQFKQYASLADVRETLSNGRSIQHSITVPEGLTSEQIVQRIRENDILDGDIRTVPREGALLPDTYRFERGTSREQILARMEREQRRVLQEIWSRRSAELPLKNPSDLVILASIVEKETGRADERTRVASVFINRLNRGMRLESDPTIIYGLVGGKGTLGRGILATEVRQPTPYNTYVISGLPPGPIANPGRASMEATANPSKTRDIFFVADGTGGHAFAETYEQHQRNVARWRQIEGGTSGQTPPVAPPPAAAPAPVAPAAPAPRRGQQRTEQQPGVAPPPSGAPALPALAQQLQPPGTAPAATAPAPSIFSIPQADLSFLQPQAPAGIAGAFADERQLPTSSGDIESYPVAPNRRQEMQRNASQIGVPLPRGGAPEAASVLAAQADSDVPVGAPQRRPRAFDASEGTSRDPLRNKSFDLSSPKTVPSLR
jgi:UPF0755 protein